MKINKQTEIKPVQKEAKKHKWLWLKIIGIVIFVLAALGLMFNQQLMGMIIHHQSDSSHYLKVSKTKMKANSKKKGNFESKSAVPVSPANLAKAVLANQTKPIIGGVAVPAIGINLPIMLDDGDYSMLYGAGPLQANQVMGEGNYTLASHDMWTNASYYSHTLLFTPLKRAQKGQDVYLTDKQKVYHYVIYEISRIRPTEWDSTVNNIPGQSTVTLVTCDTNDSYRIRVRGKLQDVKEYNDTTAVPFTGHVNQYRR